MKDLVGGLVCMNFGMTRNKMKVLLSRGCRRIGPKDLESLRQPLFYMGTKYDNLLVSLHPVYCPLRNKLH